MGRGVMNGPVLGSANFTSVSRRLWEMSRLSPSDVDVIQSYENFSGGVVVSLVEHGLCEAEAVDDLLTLEQLSAPSGHLPLNTSGGNLAEAYIHGFNLAIEGVRQLRGDSVNQVPDAEASRWSPPARSPGPLRRSSSARPRPSDAAPGSCLVPTVRELSVACRIVADHGAVDGEKGALLLLVETRVVPDGLVGTRRPPGLLGHPGGLGQQVLGGELQRLGQSRMMPTDGWCSPRSIWLR